MDFSSVLALPSVRVFVSVATAAIALSPVLRIFHDIREARLREREVRAQERIAAAMEKII